ncbi:MAG: Trm112 family protein [Candidatus Lokiarchaeota archaeon]
MKLWLFDILACPIDKYYPLKLYIFKYLEDQTQFEMILKKFKSRNIAEILDEDLISIYDEAGRKFIKDQITIKRFSLKHYLKKILQSIEELENIIDKSQNETSNEILKLLKLEVKSKIIEFWKNDVKLDLELILPELYLLNKIKVDVEIESGILFCNKCKRWFPIIESIPRMLPDKYRDVNQEKEFLKNHKNLLNEKFLQQNLKPFNI